MAAHAQKKITVGYLLVSLVLRHDMLTEKIDHLLVNHVNYITSFKQAHYTGRLKFIFMYSTHCTPAGEQFSCHTCHIVIPFELAKLSKLINLPRHVCDGRITRKFIIFILRLQRKKFFAHLHTI